MSEKWIRFRFGDSGSSYGGLVNKCSDDFGQGKPFVTYMNVFSNCKTKDDCFEFVDIGLHEHQNAICKGDVLFTTSSETPDEVGMSSVVTFDPQESVYLNSFCFGFRFSESTNLDPNFSAYLFRGRSVRNFMSMIAQGSTRYNLPKRYLFKDLYLIVPADISTQRHIAEVLSTCDEVIEKSELAAEKYRQIKTGMLKDLLTRGIDNRGKLRPPPFASPELYKDSELGPMPKEWAVKRLGDAGEVITGSTPSRADDKNWNGEFNWVSAKDFTDKYIYRSVEQISEQGKRQCRLLPRGTVLVTCIASIGLNAIAVEECATNQQINAVVCRNCDNEFFYYQICFRESELKRLAGQTAVPILSKSDFQEIQLVFPPLAEQRAIAERLAAVDERITAEVKAVEKYRKVKAGLMEKLLTPPADAEIEDLTQEVAG